MEVQEASRPRHSNLLPSPSLSVWLTCVQKSVFEPRLVTGLKKQKIAAMAGGSHHTLALTTFGEVLAYGRTTYGRLGRLNAQFEENVGEETPELVDGLEGVAVESISAGLSSA